MSQGLNFRIASSIDYFISEMKTMLAPSRHRTRYICIDLFIHSLVQIFTEYYHKPYIVLETFKYIIFFKPHNPMSQGKLIFSCLQMRMEPGFELRFPDVKAQCSLYASCFQPSGLSLSLIDTQPTSHHHSDAN